MSKKMNILLLLLVSGILGALITFAHGLDSWENHLQYGPDRLHGKIDVKNSPYYVKLDVYNLTSNNDLTVIPHFATRQQKTNYSCGPCAAAMVVFNKTGKDLHSEKEIAKIMETSTTKGTTLSGMVKYFKEIGWQVRSTLDSTTPKDYSGFLKFVKTNLSNNVPIIVENVDWGGHWRVIIGYDTMGSKETGDDVLIMADPFDTTDHCQDGYNIVPAERFFYMWFDAKLYKEGERDKLWLTAVPK